MKTTGFEFIVNKKKRLFCCSKTNSQLKLFFLFVYLFLLLSSPAQDHVISIKQYGIKEGLSHRQVNAVLKDKRGLLWVGTRYGLNRFDGYEFVWYTQEKNGMPFNNIEQLAEDGTGNIWIRGGTNRTNIAVL